MAIVVSGAKYCSAGPGAASRMKAPQPTKTPKIMDQARSSAKSAAMELVPELTVVQHETQPIPASTVVQPAKANKKVEPSTRVLRSRNKQK